MSSDTNPSRARLSDVLRKMFPPDDPRQRLIIDSPDVALESYDTSDNPAPLECLAVHGNGECACFPACFSELEQPREEGR